MNYATPAQYTLSSGRRMRRARSKRRSRDSRSPSDGSSRASLPSDGLDRAEVGQRVPRLDAESEGGGRPSILAMVWLRPPPWVQSEVVTPIELLHILPMAGLAALAKVKLSSP